MKTLSHRNKTLLLKLHKDVIILWMVSSLLVIVSFLNRVFHSTSRVSGSCFSVLFHVGFPINLWILCIFILLVSIPPIKDVLFLFMITNFV